jgi:hypothetical protein
MEIIVGSIVYLKTDDENNINLQNIDAIRILPKEDAGDDKNIIEATIGGNTIQVTDYLPRAEAETKLNEILTAQQTYTTNGITYNAPQGHFEVKNLYVDSQTNRLVVQYSDIPT